MDITTNGATLTLVGDFDVRSTSQVRYAVYEHLALNEGAVVVDLTDVDNIDVTALRLLAVATRYAWLSGSHLTLRNPGPSVRRMIHLSRLAHAVEIEHIAATA